MLSHEGEEVLFNSKIDVNHGFLMGKVDLWMLQIEKAMRETVRDLAYKSINNLHNIERIDWLCKWPGQII